MFVRYTGINKSLLHQGHHSGHKSREVHEIVGRVVIKGYRSCAIPPYRRGGSGYQTPAPSSQGSVSVDGGDLMDRSICGSPEQGSPRAFERSITGTPRQSSMGAEEIPFPKTPRLAESAIPLSSIVGAFRPQRSPPPLVVVAPSNDQSIVWHPPPN